MPESTPQWKEPAVPRSVVQALVVDRNHNLLLIHRSPSCKSAANVWSLPSGTHEIGEHALDCLARELDEEFSLIPKIIYLATQYENIAGDTSTTEQYHWVITLYVVVVDDLALLKNNEPDRHDQTNIIHINKITDPLFTQEYNFHPSLQELFATQSEYLAGAMQHGIDELNSNILSF